MTGAQLEYIVSLAKFAADAAQAVYRARNAPALRAALENIGESLSEEEAALERAWLLHEEDCTASAVEWEAFTAYLTARGAVAAYLASREVPQ